MPIRRFLRCQSGAVAVEFVLLSPMLLALLFGIVWVGYFMAVSQSVQALAAGAARASVAGLDTAERRTLAEAYLSEGPARYPILPAAALSHALDFGPSDRPDLTIRVSVAIDGSLLGIANGVLGLDLRTIDGRAYLAY